MVFSISKPFRQPLYTNLPFTLSLTILFALNIFMTFSTDGWVLDLFGLEHDVSMQFKLSMMAIVIVNTGLSYLYEKMVIWWISQWWKQRQERAKAKEQHIELVDR